ncbi:MAG: biotin--[acetyl-CoA-carboxylase] ligase [Steroidobacteraceae bacterium]|nr:biotin--[acetyl-CoA-carboxylase] ligase [Steroidobacteraceae bacterium]
MTLAEQIFRRLGDGRLASGQALAAELGVTPSALLQAVQALEEAGARIETVSNRGYRLCGGIVALDAARILAMLPAGAQARVARCEVAWTLPSTNAALLAAAEPPCGQAAVMLAEHQTAGRGRRGRQWVAPLGGALCLSIAWSFAGLPRDLAALSLVAGVCALRAFAAGDVRGLALKWPNDLLAGGRKLGGILIEMRAESSGPSLVVIGIGVNVALGADARARVAATGNEVADFVELGGDPDRNVLVARLIGEIVTALPKFAVEGFAPFAAEWRQADVLRGRAVSVLLGADTQVGIARGVCAGGALLVETPTGLKHFVAGEVSVRVQA